MIHCTSFESHTVIQSISSADVPHGNQSIQKQWELVTEQNAYSLEMQHNQTQKFRMYRMKIYTDTHFTQ